MDGLLRGSHGTENRRKPIPNAKVTLLSLPSSHCPWPKALYLLCGCIRPGERAPGHVSALYAGMLATERVAQQASERAKDMNQLRIGTLDAIYVSIERDRGSERGTEAVREGQRQ